MTEQINPNGPEALVSNVDRTHRTFVDYIERTRAHYLMEGFGNPYRWSFFDEVPFTPMAKPARESRIALITTAAPFRPEKGDQGPRAPYNNDAKFQEVYALPTEPPPDLRISHIGYDRANTVPEDINAYFPLAQMQAFARDGRIGSLPPRFYAAPTLRSQRHTIETDAPAILEWCREDRVDAAVIVAV
jgi:D-proline reductase (dithiol) PrdB